MSVLGLCVYRHKNEMNKFDSLKSVSLFIIELSFPCIKIDHIHQIFQTSTILKSPSKFTPPFKNAIEILYNFPDAQLEECTYKTNICPLVATIQQLFFENASPSSFFSSCSS